MLQLTGVLQLVSFGLSAHWYTYRPSCPPSRCSVASLGASRLAGCCISGNGASVMTRALLRSAGARCNKAAPHPSFHPPCQAACAIEVCIDEQLQRVTHAVRQRRALEKAAAQVCTHLQLLWRGWQSALLGMPRKTGRGGVMYCQSPRSLDNSMPHTYSFHFQSSPSAGAPRSASAGRCRAAPGACAPHCPPGCTYPPWVRLPFPAFD